jgi:hypothetical protein
MKIKNNQVILCCGGKKCPILSDLENGMIKIEDDFGGSITIKKEQALLVNDAVNKLSHKKHKK